MNGFVRTHADVCCGVVLSLALWGAVSPVHASLQQEPTPSTQELQAAIDVYWQSRPQFNGQMAGWKVTEVQGCVPAYDEKRQRPWANHWVCVAKTSLPDFYADALVKQQGSKVQVLDLGADPACAPLADAQTQIRQIIGDPRVKVTAEIDDGQGTLTDSRLSTLKEKHPYRIWCRYESNYSTYHAFIWYKNGGYVFDAGDLSGIGVPEPRFIHKIEPNAAQTPTDASKKPRPTLTNNTPANWSVGGDRLWLDEALLRVPLIQQLASFPYLKDDENNHVRIVDGDLTIDGDLWVDFDKAWSSAGLVVTGNLTVNGAIINAEGDYGPFLLVLGTTKAHAIVGGGSEFKLMGHATVDQLVLGHYNHGILQFAAGLSTPVLINMDHHIDTGPRFEGRAYDFFGEQAQWNSVLQLSAAELAAMNQDEWKGLDDIIIPRLLNRGQLVRQDALKPQRKAQNN